MSSEHPEGFVSNWAYLKTELNWLERLLVLAVGHQRKDTKEIDRVARTRADKATSHWWKGVLTLEGSIAYDEHRKTVPNPPQSYQQQLETQIQASRQRGIMLALPALCDRLHLTPFEKNVILIGLAPEVNRRYAALYRYLQNEDGTGKLELPTVDLALRLFCRNDVEWRVARLRLGERSPLTQHHIVRLARPTTNTFLNTPIQLPEPVMQYLMAEQPTVDQLESLLYAPAALPAPKLKLATVKPTHTWADLVLPDALLHSLQQITEQLKIVMLPTELMGTIPTPGQFVLLAGAQGTGKTSAAEAIARALHHPLTVVDLEQLDPLEYANYLTAIQTQAPSILLIKGAQHWLRRSAVLPATDLQRWWSDRQTQPTLTLFEVEHAESIALRWQRQMSQVLHFPLPNVSDRLKLWQNALSSVPCSADIDWERLARQVRVTGGEIGAIAQTAIALGKTQSDSLAMAHILAALEQHGHRFRPQ